MFKGVKMIAEDMSKNQLKNGQYYNFTADMNYAIRTTGHFYISIFT
jgi:hypothetical protein